MEQVCRALVYLVDSWMRRERETSARVNMQATIAYHQRRNKAARESKQRRKVIERTNKKPRPPRRKRKPRSTVKSK
jgi:hypothetical protein